MTIQVRCYKAANNAHTAVASIAPGYTGWTAVAPYANTAPVAGDLIVVVGLFTLTSGNVTQSAGTGSYTFITTDGDANASANPYTSWCAYRQYTSGDTGPTFAWSGTTTAYCYLIFALTSSAAGGSVSFDASGTPVVDTSSTTAHTPGTASASTALDAAIVLNAARYQTSGSHAISMTTPCVGYSAIHIAGYAGATGFFANSCSAYMDTPVGAGTITPGAETFNEAVTNNAYTLLASEFIPVPPYTGGPQGWSSPAGVRAVYVRTGLAMASQIPLPASSSPVILTASLPGGIISRPYTATLSASGGTLPYTWSISSGSLPAGLSLAPSTGVISGTPAGPAGTVSFTVKVTDASSNTATKPLSITITAAPVVQSGPVRARITPPPRGRTWSNPGGPVQNPPPPPPPAPFRPQGAVRAKIPQPYPRRGTCRTIRFLPVSGQPQPGPAFYPAVQPVRARIPQVAPRGRIGSNKGTLAVKPVVTGPPVYPLQGPVKARLPQQPLLRGRTYSNPGAPVRNPHPGPVFRQAVRPAAARLPVPFLKGRVSGNPGGPLRDPGTGPAFTPFFQALRAKLPVPFLKGRGSGNPGTAPRNPGTGPAFRPAAAPARARITPPPRGRIASGLGGPVPGPPVVAAFRQAAAPARIRPGLPPRGRISFNAGAPVRNPGAGPVFRPAVQPARIRVTLPPRGRIGSNPGGPVPPPPIVAIFHPATSPARARIPQNAPRGRVYSRPGAPLRNPNTGPVFQQAVRPVQARFPLPPSGRIASNPGGPVRNPVVPAPVYPLHSPVQARFPLPPRGRTGGNKGSSPPPPPVPAKVYPAQGPVRFRITLPPRGRIASGPGAPLRNPNPGPVFRQAVRPVRAVIPQNAPRGRTFGNPGGPVENIPFTTLRFRTGEPYVQWDTGTAGFQWVTGEPGFQWDTGTPEAG